jgi:hypothetical protein
MSEVVKDIFDTTSITMPVEVTLPEKIVKKPEVEKIAGPARTIISKTSLTPTEYAIYNSAFDGLQELIDNFGTMDEKFERDANSVKLKLLDVLAQKFGYSNAVTAKQDGLSFKMKANHEVELLKSNE